MADAPDAPNAASLLSVLLQLPADVVETNIIKIIGRDGVHSLMLCSREAAAVVRRSRSTLTLRAVNGDELTLQQVRDRATQLGLYTSVHALTLLVGRTDDVNFLMVSTTMPCMATCISCIHGLAPSSSACGLPGRAIMLMCTDKCVAGGPRACGSNLMQLHRTGALHVLFDTELDSLHDHPKPGTPPPFPSGSIHTPPSLPSLQELLHLSRDSLGAHVRSCTVYRRADATAGPRAGPTDLSRLISWVAACLAGLQKLKVVWFDSPPEQPCRALLLWAPLRALHHLQELDVAWPSPSDEAMRLDLELQVRGPCM